MSKSVVSRRRFLWLSSAFSAGLLAAIPRKLQRSPAIASPMAPPQRLSKQASIGFWQESSQLSSFKAVSWQSVAQSSTQSNLIAADALVESDRAFFTEGAKVQIQGLYSAAAVQSLEVYAHYPAGDAHDAQKVCVWSFRATPTPSASAPVSFVMPVSQSEGLTFSMVWQYRNPDGSGEKEEAIAQFALKPASSMAKLQRGIYLLAGRDAQTGRQPEWQNYRLQVIESDRDDQRHQLHQIDQPQLSSTLPYLLMAIDYPSPHLGHRFSA